MQKYKAQGQRQLGMSMSSCTQCVLIPQHLECRSLMRFCCMPHASLCILQSHAQPVQARRSQASAGAGATHGPAAGAHHPAQQAAQQAQPAAAGKCGLCLLAGPTSRLPGCLACQLPPLTAAACSSRAQRMQQHLRSPGSSTCSLPQQHLPGEGLAAAASLRCLSGQPAARLLSMWTRLACWARQGWQTLLPCSQSSSCGPHLMAVRPAWQAAGAAQCLAWTGINSSSSSSILCRQSRSGAQRRLCSL